METEKKTQKSTKKIQSKLQTLTTKDIDVSNIKEAKPEAFATYVRVLQQNWRQGTLGSKGRADISLSNKKPFKQKGTGRARAGSARSPLWRKGGVVFGPQARTRILTLSKKSKNSVMRTLLLDFLNGKIFTADWSFGEIPKTAIAAQYLKDAGLKDKKVALLLQSSDLLTAASFANIPHVNTFFFDQPNVFDLANSDYWVFLKKDLGLFKEMVSKWI